MATKPSSQPQGRPVSNLPGHEKKDASFGSIVAILVFLFLAGVAMHFTLAGMLRWLRRQPLTSDRWRPAQSAANSARFASGTFPKLQITPPLDLKEFRVREDAELNGYGWVDKTAGVVRIPISRAMDLLLEKGLPVRQSTNENKTGPSSLELQQQRALKRQPETQSQQ